MFGYARGGVNTSLRNREQLREQLEPRALDILVADDERDTVLTLSAILEAEGHSVHGVYKGSDVIPAMRSHKPDAVILDIGLPGPSGYAIAREVREVYCDEAPLLSAITGQHTGQTDKMLAQLAGFDHYCIKPCEPRELLRLLAESPRLKAKRADPTFGRTLVVAAELIGGTEKLSEYLGVSSPDLLAWMKGNGHPATLVFLKAVDVLLDHVGRMSKDDETIHPPTISGAASIET